VLVNTDLPESATLSQRLLYPFLRHFFYFFFAYLPYAPVRRVNRPDLSGPFLWASSHSNYLCDTIPAGCEAPRPTKFLAKSTLFRFPIKGFIEFCGALPVARAEDHKGQAGEARALQNRSTFKVAIGAMEKGWPVAIYPEGVSIESPGLVLPLKPGVAKLGFAAEEANEFKLGLRIIPVGLEYGSRSKVGSGLTIRYGKPLALKDYEILYRESRDEAVKKLMFDLTVEMIRNFPHFQDETKLGLARKLVALGLARSKFPVAQLFLKKENDGAFWAGLEQRLRAFEEANKGRRIPVPAWGHRRAWKELGPRRRRVRGAFLFLGLPLAAVDLVNNSIPELCLSSAVEQLSVDETEVMSLRFMLSPIVLGAVYGLQFYFFKEIVFPEFLAEAGFGSYVLYALGSFSLWYFGLHWRRQFKRVASLWFFRRAGVDGRSEAVAYYRALRQYLGDFQNHSREGSEHGQHRV
jgi:1-acyl-sn-glycerol-3-phosphate acyltransferase